MATVKPLDAPADDGVRRKSVSGELYELGSQATASDDTLSQQGAFYKTVAQVRGTWY